MRFDDVNFRVSVFADHPVGWQTPADLAEAYVLAWALEVQARRRVDPGDPFGRHVLGYLPRMFSYDTLGSLVRLTAAECYSSFPSVTERARLTTLCIVWTLFDELNTKWQLTTGDMRRYADMLAFVTGGPERRSLFTSLSADWAKCLLSDRVARTFFGRDELTEGEEWVVTGDWRLSTPNDRGGRTIPFRVGTMAVPMYVLTDSFVTSTWSAARVLVELRSPEEYIERYGQRRGAVLEILEKGVAEFEKRTSLPYIEAVNYKPWPGWPSTA